MPQADHDAGRAVPVDVALAAMHIAEREALDLRAEHVAQAHRSARDMAWTAAAAGFVAGAIAGIWCMYLVGGP